MKQKQQVMHIHGGTSFGSYEDYLNYLKTCPVEIDFNQKNEKRWYRIDGYSNFLGNEHYQIIIPLMPSKYNAKYNEWKIWFERHIDFLRDDIILIGHSQGGIFLAKYLSENKLSVSIKQLHLVAPVYGFEDDNDKLVDFKIDIFPNNFFENNIGQVHIYHSKDDTVVPISESEKYHELLPDSIFHIFEDRFHFLDETFPELFENIKNADK